MNKQLRTFISATERDGFAYSQHRISAEECLSRLFKRIEAAKVKYPKKLKRVKTQKFPAGVLLPRGRGTEPFLIRSKQKSEYEKQKA